jgi:hypothetical protein
LIIGAASVTMQTGYLAGMLVRHALGASLARRSSSFSDTRSARDPAH